MSVVVGIDSRGGVVAGVGSDKGVGPGGDGVDAGVGGVR